MSSQKTRNIYFLITLFIGFSMLLSACSSPTLSPFLANGSVALSLMNAGKPLAQPQTTAVPGDPALILGRPDGIENFDNANNWATFDNECFSSEITGGQFVMTAKGMPHFLAGSSPGRG